MFNQYAQYTPNNAFARFRQGQLQQADLQTNALQQQLTQQKLGAQEMETFQSAMAAAAPYVEAGIPVPEPIKQRLSVVGPYPDDEASRNVIRQWGEAQKPPTQYGTSLTPVDTDGDGRPDSYVQASETGEIKTHGDISPPDERGKPTARMREAEAAGLEPGTPEYNEFLLRDGEATSVSERSRAEARKILSSPEDFPDYDVQWAKRTLYGTTKRWVQTQDSEGNTYYVEEDVVNDGKPPVGTQNRLIQANRAADVALGALTDLKGKVGDAGRQDFGLPATIRENTAGYLDFFGLEEASEWVADDEFLSLRSTAKNTFGPIIPIVTNDTSGRYSDLDIKRAEDALSVLSNSRGRRSARTAINTLIRFAERFKAINNSYLEGEAGQISEEQDIGRMADDIVNRINSGK